jgi:hypothetical protein
MHWREGPDRLHRRRGSPPVIPILLGTVLSLGLAGIVATLLGTQRRFPATALPRTPVAAATRPSAITRPQTAGARFIRAVARRQLGLAARQLDACSRGRTAELSRRALPGWRDCVRWPVAHLAISSRTNAALMGGLAGELPIGACRSIVLGTSNTSRILGSEADELLRSLFNTTSQGRGLSDQRYLSVTELIATVRGMIRSPKWGTCHPPSGTGVRDS